MSANPTMMKSASLADKPVVAHRHGESINSIGDKRTVEYRVLYVLVFAVCLVIAGLSRLLPRHRHPWIDPQSDEPNSLWSEARSAADSSVPYVFQQ